jgi:hypothetical protein|eukprot:COSAG02_NODE_619_length_19446_cov_9.557141_14_plen_245_part_00
MHEPEPEQAQAQQLPASKPAFPKEYLCTLKANVRPSVDLDGPKLRVIQPGARVMILEIATRQGHLRGRIESESVGHDSEWLSIRTKLGNQLLVPVDGGPLRSDLAPEPGFPPDQTVERVKFLAPKTRLDGEGKPYTVYCVRCFPQEAAPWEVERRFSDFYSLWYELEAAGATAVNRLDFPSRTTSLFASKEALEQERRTTLEQFLNFLISLGGTESLDKKVGNCWPGEKATMLFLAPWSAEDFV